jgi:hypothetical protein
VPICSSNIDPTEGPRPPVSGGNIDEAQLRTLKFDEPTDEQKSAQRVRKIAAQMQAGAPWTPGPLEHIADAASLSTARPISALAGAATGGLLNSYPDSTMGERYQAALQYMNDRAAQAEKNTPFAPVVGAVAQLPASMAMPGVRGATAPASTLKVMGQAAIPGAIEGASQHAESIPEAIKGGATNAAFSAVPAGVLDKGTKALLPAAKRGAAAEATAARGATGDELKAEAKTYFNQLDNNGIAYSPQQTASLYTALHDLRNSSVFVPSANPALVDHFNDLLKLTRQGATFNELDNARSAISKQTRNPDPSTREAAGAMLGEIDRLIGSGPPAINPNNVNVKEAYSTARDMWRKKSLSEDASWHADNVSRKEAINSGIDPNKATKAEFGAIEKRVNKPGAYNPHNQEQRDLLSRIVRGDPVQNVQGNVGAALRGNANLAGIGAAGAAGSLGLWKGFDLPHSVAGGLVGVPVTVASKVAGGALENAAARRGQENVNALIRSLSGSPKPVPGDAITRGDLAKILFAQDLERLAPRVGSQVIGNQPDQEKKTP